MKVAILAAAGALNYRLVDKKLNELIETSGCYLFYILCGYVDGKKSSEETIGEKWARENGLPVLYTHAKTREKLVDRIILEADYAIFVFGENTENFIKNAFMRYKMSGKHGTVIKKE